MVVLMVKELAANQAAGRRLRIIDVCEIVSRELLQSGWVGVTEKGRHRQGVGSRGSFSAQRFTRTVSCCAGSTAPPLRCKTGSAV